MAATEKKAPHSGAFLLLRTGLLGAEVERAGDR